MQKALRINVLGRNNQLKKVRKNIFEKRKDQEKEFDQFNSRRSKLTREHRRSERRNRREDWINGELAADRNVGLNKGVLGTVDSMFTQNPAVPKNLISGKRWDRPEYNIVVGDRVCVVRGGDEIRGKIGLVKSADPSKGVVTLENMNMVSGPIHHG